MRWFRVFLLLLALSCGREEDKPDILLITLDTTRSDYISCLGGMKAKTPYIDALAQKGVLFRRAFSAVPLTLPAHATLMTGLYPPGHGVRNNGSYRVTENVRTLAAVLRDAGYTTGAVVGSVVLDSQFGLDAGFSHYDDAMPQAGTDRPGATSAERRGHEVTAAALSFLEKAGSSPFFLWVHYFDPHDPYEPPGPFDREYSSDPYAGEIAYADACLGTLIEHVESRREGKHALIAILGDHGEDLGDHGENTHGVFLYESTMRVPLIVSLPGKLPQGAVCDSPVSVADIFPTILDILGIEEGGLALQGRSVLGFLEEGKERESPLYIETRFPLESMGWSPLEGIILGEWKYIRAPRSELYHTAADPMERRNLIDEEPERARAMEALLDSLERTLATGEASGAGHEPEAETLEKLASLGYIESPVSEEAPLKDPKEMAPLLALRERGFAHMGKGEYEHAEAAFREALQVDPTNVFIQNQLGLSLSHMGRTREAMEVWGKALRTSPGYLDVLVNVAAVYLSSGKADSALWAYDQILRVNPRFLGALMGKARALLLAGRYDMALAALEAISRERPSDPALHFLLATCYRQTGDPARSLAELEEALRIEPGMKKAKREQALVLIDLGNPEKAVEILSGMRDEGNSTPTLLVDLGFALEKSGRTEEALASYARAVSLAPQLPQPHYSLGRLLAGLGRTEEARKEYTAFLSLWKGDEEMRRKVEREIENLASSHRQF